MSILREEEELEAALENMRQELTSLKCSVEVKEDRIRRFEEALSKVRVDLKAYTDKL